MPEQGPILITGAGGEIGGVSRMIAEALLEQGHAVRAFVRRDDERAGSLRRAGAEVFVGDVLTFADVTAALNGCRRVYFSMGLSPYYTDAVVLMVAAARAQGGIEVLVNISEYEQSFMTFEKMAAPQHLAHWIAERVLARSGLPVVNVRATMFVENPLLTWLPLGPLGNGELRLPFGDRKIAPIAGHDVAELTTKILTDPAPHISRSYDLTGPELKDMHGFAEDYAAVLGRPVSYIPEDVETWNTAYIDPALGDLPHAAEHLKTLTRLVAGGRFDVVTDQLEILLGRPPKTVRWALANNLRLQKGAAG